MGGGTGDIATHKKEINGYIDEAYHSIGGDYGSDGIDKHFYDKVIYKIFGFKDYIALLKKNKEIRSPWNEYMLFVEWMNLLQAIQNKKKMINLDLENKAFFLNCQLFEDFIDQINLQELVDIYNKECQKDWEVKIKTKWFLIFPYKILFNLINEHARKISNLLIDIYKKVEDINCILYVGGYSTNEILLNKIKNEIKNVVHLRPSRPEVAVVKGAVLFCLNPDIIKIRKAPYTIGFNCDHVWDDAIHSGIGQKYFDCYYNIFKCQNTFDKFIEVGQNICKGQKITRNFIAMNSRFIYLKFLKQKSKSHFIHRR